MPPRNRSRRRRKQPFRTQVGSRNGVRGGGGVRRPRRDGPGGGGPQNFLPFSPEFESGRRGLEDQYAQTRMGLTNQQMMIDPMLKLQMERLGTDRGYAQRSLDESLNERGIFTSGIRPQLHTRDINIPFGRERQDLSNQAAADYAALAGQFGGADLAYNQGLQELYLQLADQQAQNMPLSLPQYGGGGGQRNRNRRRRRRRR